MFLRINNYLILWRIYNKENAIKIWQSTNADMYYKYCVTNVKMLLVVIKIYLTFLEQIIVILPNCRGISASNLKVYTATCSCEGSGRSSNFCCCRGCSIIRWWCRCCWTRWKKCWFTCCWYSIYNCCNARYSTDLFA